MNRFLKFLNFFDSHKVKELRKLAPMDEIMITTPKGYHKKIGDTILYDQPICVVVMNNDIISNKLWIVTENSDEFRISFILKYNSRELKDFILLNMDNKNFEEESKSKEELQNELRNAIFDENFEMAKLINEKIKELN